MLTNFSEQNVGFPRPAVPEVDADIPEFWSRRPASKETLIGKIPLFPLINRQRV
jgi:hypothetical protein